LIFRASFFPLTVTIYSNQREKPSF